LLVKGAILKTMRIEAGLTQSKLAALVGVSQAHIAKIEGEKVDPRLSTVNKILLVLAGGRGKKCREIMTKGVFSACLEDNVRKASEIMIKHAVSQLPIVEGENVVGMITEEGIIRNLDSELAEKPVNNIMNPPLPSVPENTDISVIRPLLETHSGVLVTKNGKLSGIITRSDLLKVISRLFPETGTSS
jgi:predicted transcriptional regulator